MVAGPDRGARQDAGTVTCGSDSRRAKSALISPAEAALAMVRGFEHGEFEIHFPKRFTRWLKILRLLPYRLYFPIIHRFTGL